MAEAIARTDRSLPWVPWVIVVMRIYGEIDGRTPSRLPEYRAASLPPWERRYSLPVPTVALTPADLAEDAQSSWRLPPDSRAISLPCLQPLRAGCDVPTISAAAKGAVAAPVECESLTPAGARYRVLGE